MKKVVWSLLVIFCGSIILSGCRDTKTTGEKVEDSVENAADKMEEGAEDAADEVEDAYEDVNEEIDRVTDDSQ
ncbi:MAG TPA: hypothetical protein VKN36_11315 [Eudoraea sp.]|nr:hypothetical protein [Eudoraea sp.]